eukprot:4720568-Prymnesium_polylepis.1
MEDGRAPLLPSSPQPEARLPETRPPNTHTAEPQQSEPQQSEPQQPEPQPQSEPQQPEPQPQSEPQQQSDPQLPEPQPPEPQPPCPTCLYRIPLCGGFCAPTVSPETTALRTFGNEYTVPGAACCESYKCRSYVEHSRLCVSVGGVGIKSFATSKWRARTMLCSFWLQLVSTVLYILGSLALSTSEATVSTFAWASFDLALHELNVIGQLEVGIRSRVVLLQGVSYNGTHIVLDPGGEIRNTERWGDTSCYALPSAPNSLMGACRDCHNSAQGSTAFILMTIISQLPTMTTDLQRTTPYADVNCRARRRESHTPPRDAARTHVFGWASRVEQFAITASSACARAEKFMGIATNLWGMFTGLSTLSSFGYWCWRSIPGTIEMGGHVVTLHGRGGVGYALFVVGILLKLTDVIAHLLVPTPAAKRRPVEPGSSFGEYLARCPEPTKFGALIEDGVEIVPGHTCDTNAPIN